MLPQNENQQNAAGRLDLSTETGFKYDTHIHTCESSACAFDTAADLVRAYAEAGYHGFIVTDHFFNGNTTVPSHLPWETRVNLFCKGYENAKAVGDTCDFQVFFGWEYAYYGTEFLTYGLDKDFLLNHPDMMSWNLEKYFGMVHDSGGFISHAHPFREAYYISTIRLFPKDVDAVEVINSSHTDPKFNEKALQYAQMNSLPQTCGSDTHHAYNLLGGGMEFDHELNLIEDFIKAVRYGNR